MKKLGGNGDAKEASTYAHHMKEAIFMMPTPRVLSNVVHQLAAIDMADRDTKGERLKKVHEGLGAEAGVRQRGAAALIVLTLLGASAETVDAARLEAGSTTQIRPLGKGLHHVWVPAGMLSDLAALEAIRPGLAEHLERTLQLLHGGDCLGYIDEGSPTLPGGLGEAVATARTVLVGTVAEGTPGFLGTTPGTLYRVFHLETLESDAAVADSGLFFVPGGTFSVGETTVCVKSNDVPKHRPEVGKRVLLLLSFDWSGDEELIPVSPFEGLLTERADGAYHAPRNHYLRTPIEAGIESFDDLVLRLREREEKP